MKKSNLTIIAALLCLLAAACAAAVFLKYRSGGDSSREQEGHINPMDEEDYMDDLDVPDIPSDPEKEEKAGTKVRRGYFPIRLNRA